MIILSKFTFSMASSYGYCTDCGYALRSNYGDALCDECFSERGYALHSN